MEASVEGRTMTSAELSERWSIPVSTLAHWRSLGQGPAYVKLRGAVRYRLRDVEAFEDAHLVPAGASG
ncbi:MAG: helix-turn-helix domain-containing protein [Bifidobacteriaceae bacterium]|jgi:hypothetical protein|nr:helix-turn-helix domain-containing protein [Bifidobacteriaceae bacterium]